MVTFSFRDYGENLGTRHLPPLSAVISHWFRVFDIGHLIEAQLKADQRSASWLTLGTQVILRPRGEMFGKDAMGFYPI